MPTQTLPRTRNGTPKLARTDDVIEYWAERIELCKPEWESFRYSSMICESDSIFHYGHHFELARIMRTKTGRTRLVLLNGDSYGGASGFGPSTADRQSQARRAVEQSSAAGVVVPFSALDSAGIDYTTVEPIEVRADRRTVEQRESRTRPTDRLSSMEDPSGATRTQTYWDWSERLDRSIDWREREVPGIVPDPNRTAWFTRGHASSEGAERGEDGIWRWTETRHWLGDCIFRARLTETRTRKATREEIGSLRRRRSDPRGRVAYRVTRWATFISSFDYQEPRALYFLAELPYGAKPRTVDEAIGLLRPPEVIAAQARGLNVLRQGDVFAIPTKLDRAQLRRLAKGDFAKRLKVLDTDHSVTEGVICKGGATFGRGIMRHDVDGWRTPDHVRLKLGDGKTWHLLIRNTVPRSH